MFEIIFNKKFCIKYNNNLLYVEDLISYSPKNKIKIIEYDSLSTCFKAIEEYAKIHYINKFTIEVM